MVDTSRVVDIVFDGLPGRAGPRFVEVENDAGRSIRFGTLVPLDDGFWALRIDGAVDR